VCACSDCVTRTGSSSRSRRPWPSDRTPAQLSEDRNRANGMTS
jgi:hypothetical protein